MTRWCLENKEGTFPPWSQKFWIPFLGSEDLGTAPTAGAGGSGTQRAHSNQFFPYVMRALKNQSLSTLAW